MSVKQLLLDSGDEHIFNHTVSCLPRFDMVFCRIEPDQKYLSKDALKRIQHLSCKKQTLGGVTGCMIQWGEQIPDLGVEVWQGCCIRWVIRDHAPGLCYRNMPGIFINARHMPGISQAYLNAWEMLEKCRHMPGIYLSFLGI